MSRKKMRIKINATGPEPDVTETAETVASGNETADAAGAAPAAFSEETAQPGLGVQVEQALRDEVAGLQTQLAQAETRASEYLEGLQRERAEFQNYKKRIERERAEQQQAAVSGVLLKLLSPLDDFHRAMDAIPADQRDNWFEGVSLIQRKLENLLKEYGVSEIESEGQPFDPNLHEAIGVDEASDAASGTVTQVVQRGYKLHDRVLRAAYVRVAK